MNVNLQIKVHPEFGPDVDVQPDSDFLRLSFEEQQAVLLEAMRSLEHQIIMLSQPEEDVVDA
jgi:hypothetical protein